MPTTVGEIIQQYPFLLTFAWICVGIWIGMPLAVIIAGVSGVGVILGFVFAASIAYVGNEVTRQRLHS